MSEVTRQHQPAPPTVEPTLDQPASSNPNDTQTGIPPSVGDTHPPQFNPGLPRTFGRYTLLQILGQGGMGVVYRAKQNGLDRMVALKMILSGPGASEQAVARFHREAQAASSLDHPNIVPIYDFGEEQGQHYFTMAFVQGETLHQMVDREGPPAASETTRIMVALATAMGYAHRKGLIHRDLKPDNVLMDSEGQPRILDFGLAQLVEGDRLTASGQILGTPSYMSPEQARAENNIGPASDIYSLGAVLYYMLTGRRPFVGDSVIQTLIRVANEDPVPPREVNLKVSTALDAICMRCLEKDPEHRFASAEEMIRALRGSESNPMAELAPVTRPDVARPTTKSIEKKPGSSSRRWIGIAAGVLAVCGIVAASVVFAMQKKETPTTQQAEEKIPEDPTLPRTLATDFKIDVKVVGEKTVNGNLNYLKPKAEYQLEITVDRDCYIGVWNFGEKGDVVQLFPNDEDTNNFFKANTPRVIPEENAFSANAAKRPEHMRIVATTSKWDNLKGNKEGVWIVFKSAEERKVLDERIRDLTYRRKPKPGDPVEPKVSEAVVPYWVR